MVPVGLAVSGWAEQMAANRHKATHVTHEHILIFLLPMLLFSDNTL